MPGDGCEFATLCGVHVSLDGDGTAWCVCVLRVCDWRPLAGYAVLLERLWAGVHADDAYPGHVGPHWKRFGTGLDWGTCAPTPGSFVFVLRLRSRSPVPCLRVLGDHAVATPWVRGCVCVCWSLGGPLPSHTGFQGDDPASDIRGARYLGLQYLVRLVESGVEPVLTVRGLHNTRPHMYWSRVKIQTTATATANNSNDTGCC